MKQVIVTLLVLVIVGLAGVMIFVYSGVYNVAASEEHSDLEIWLLDKMLDNSIQARTGEITAPDLSDSSMILAGYRSFDAMCVQCHGAPGVGRDAFAQGLNPIAPSLSEEAGEYSAETLFWVTKHGVKFTGMPSFGASHSDQAIWEIIAFMKQLPELGYYDYLEFEQSWAAADTAAPGDGHEGHEH